MKRYIYKSFIVISFLILFSSCYNKQELELVNPGAITSSEYFKNEAEALQATIGMYSQLHTQQLWMQFGIIHESLADDVVCGDGNSENIAIDRFNLTSTNSYLNCWWIGCFEGIARINNAIDGISKVPGEKISEETRKQMIAEGKFLRGYYYLILVSLYGDVPLYTIPIDIRIREQLFPKRTPQAEVYAQIMKDFSEAEIDLPVKWDSKYLGRATKGAAMAYLGKANLYFACQLKNFDNNPTEAKNYFTKAAVEFKSLIDAGTYHLDPIFLNNFTDNGDNNTESIWELQYSLNVGAGTWGEGGQSSTRPWLIGTPANGGWRNVIPNRYALRQLQAYEPNDSIRILGDIWGAPGSMYDNTLKYYQKLGLSSEAKIAPIDWGLRKYQFIPKDGNLFGSWSGNNMNFKFMRYADVLLMYAEAINEGNDGPDANAYSAVNEVRNRAKLSPLPTGLSKTDFFNRIVKERQIEFLGEDMRWQDIRRWKIATEVFNTLNTFNATPEGDGTIVNFDPQVHYYMPIPQNERDLNANLTQNDGYN